MKSIDSRNNVSDSEISIRICLYPKLIFLDSHKTFTLGSYEVKVIEVDQSNKWKNGFLQGEVRSSFHLALCLPGTFFSSSG